MFILQVVVFILIVFDDVVVLNSNSVFFVWMVIVHVVKYIWEVSTSFLFSSLTSQIIVMMVWLFLFVFMDGMWYWWVKVLDGDSNVILILVICSYVKDVSRLMVMVKLLMLVLVVGGFFIVTFFEFVYGVLVSMFRVVVVGMMILVVGMVMLLVEMFIMIVRFMLIAVLILG